MRLDELAERRAEQAARLERDLLEFASSKQKPRLSGAFRSG
jgi:hypothetical protein